MQEPQRSDADGEAAAKLPPLRSDADAEAAIWTEEHQRQQLLGSPESPSPKQARKLLGKARCKVITITGLFYAVKTFSAMALTTALLGTAMVGLLTGPTVEDLCHAAEGVFHHGDNHYEITGLCAVFALITTMAAVTLSSSGMKSDSKWAIIVFEFVVEMCVWGWRNATQALAAWIPTKDVGQGILCGLGILLQIFWTFRCAPEHVDHGSHDEAAKEHHNALQHGNAEEAPQGEGLTQALLDGPDVEHHHDAHEHHHDHRSVRVLAVEVAGVCTAWSTAKLMWSGLHELDQCCTHGFAAGAAFVIAVLFLSWVIGKAKQNPHVLSTDLIEMAFAVFIGVCLNEYVLRVILQRPYESDDTDDDDHGNHSHGNHSHSNETILRDDEDFEEEHKLTYAIYSSLITTLVAVVFMLFFSKYPKKFFKPETSLEERSKIAERVATLGTLAVRSGAMVIGWVWEETAVQFHCHDADEESSKHHFLAISWAIAGVSVVIGIPLMWAVAEKKESREERLQKLKEEQERDFRTAALHRGGDAGSQKSMSVRPSLQVAS